MASCHVVVVSIAFFLFKKVSYLKSLDFGRTNFSLISNLLFTESLLRVLSYCSILNIRLGMDLASLTARLRAVASAFLLEVPSSCFF